MNKTSSSKGNTYYFDAPGDPGGDGGFESSRLASVRKRARAVAKQTGRAITIWVAYSDLSAEVYMRVEPPAPKAPKAVSAAAIADHVSFLEGTLIPDLRESGTHATADDLALCVQIIRQLQGGGR